MLLTAPYITNQNPVKRNEALQAYQRAERLHQSAGHRVYQFDESLTRRWLKEITVWDDRFSVELKSGVRVEIEI